MSLDSVLRKKCISFSLRIVKMYQYLKDEHKEFVMSRQILRSGTSIGANVTEAIYACSRKDFSAKLQIARKEAAETLYWLEILYGSSYIEEPLYHSFYKDCNELLSMISSTIQTTAKD